MTDLQDAFVILPFEDEFENLYVEKIAPILEDQGFDVNKADSLDSQRAIIEDIINGITNSDLIVADLTGTNPNVFYELGIAHGLGVPTILIAQDLSELPFDLSAYKTIEYSLIFNEIGEFEEELSEIGNNHSAGDIEFGSPVSDYSDVEITYSGPQKEEEDQLPDVIDASNEEMIPRENEPEKGVLEYTSEIDDKIAELEDIFGEITEESSSLESEVLSYTHEIQKLSGTDTRTSRKRANKVARDIAGSFSTYSDFIENKTDPIDERLNFMMDAVQSFIKFSNVSEENHRKGLRELDNGISQFVKGMQSTVDDINQFQDEISGMRGLNRELDQSINNLTTSLSNLESILQEGIAKAERFKSLIENELNAAHQY